MCSLAGGEIFSGFHVMLASFFGGTRKLYLTISRDSRVTNVQLIYALLQVRGNYHFHLQTVCFAFLLPYVFMPPLNCIYSFSNFGSSWQFHTSPFSLTRLRGLCLVKSHLWDTPKNSRRNGYSQLCFEAAWWKFQVTTDKPNAAIAKQNLVQISGI